MAAKARVHIHNRQASRIWHALPQRDFIIRSNVTTPCPISNQAYLPRELDKNSRTVWANADTVKALENESARIKSVVVRSLWVGSPCVRQAALQTIRSGRKHPYSGCFSRAKLLSLPPSILPNLTICHDPLQLVI